MTKKGKVLAETTAEAEPLFYPFDRTPPDGQSCLNNIYDLFADWPIEWGWCSSCYDPQHEQRMRDHPDVRSAPSDSYSMILFEHPGCSGGITTFLHWLPRSLEISFFDFKGYTSILERMTQFGLIAWPENYLGPLRQLFCRVAINWFAHGDTLPFQLSDQTAAKISGEAISLELLLALCAVRVEHKSIVEWLVEKDTPESWRAILSILRMDQAVDDFVYFVLPNEEWEPAFKAAQDALNRRLRSDFHRIVTDEMLLAKWERASSDDPKLAAEISEAEWLRRTVRLEQSPAEREADELAIRRAIGLHVLDGDSNSGA